LCHVCRKEQQVVHGSEKKKNSIEVALKLQIMKFFMQTIENAIFGEFNGKPIAVIYEILSHLFKLVLYIPYKK